MKEIYWLTRLDAIHTISVVALTLSCISITVIGIWLFVAMIDDDEKDYHSKLKQWMKRGIFIAITSALVLTFIPTKKDAFIIWGVGGSIDYIRGNEKAMGLPDKAVNALDAWVESLSEKEE